MITIDKYGICYAPVPKNACTCIKEALFWIQNQWYFKDFMVNNHYIGIHNIHKSFITKPIQPNSSEYVDYQFRFCMLRNPIDRIISCFRNRVLRYKELKNTQYEHLEGSFDEFIEALADVCASVPSIDHHAGPQWKYVGKDRAFYTHIYNFSGFKKLENDLSELVGREVLLKRTQTSDNQIEIKPSPATVKKIEEFYAKDYEFFGQYF